MSQNLFQRLKRMLPDAPVLIGKVIELHPDDDTSTVELLAGDATQPIADGLTSGIKIRARGQWVPVGQNAFVRNGVIETRAPAGGGTSQKVGKVVSPSPFRFNGPIPKITIRQGQLDWEQTLSNYWLGGALPRYYALDVGTLPDGTDINHATGELSGVPTTVQTRTVVVACTDGAALVVPSNAFDIEVKANYLILGRFSADGTNDGSGGGTFQFGTLVGGGFTTGGTSPPVIDTTFFKHGPGALRVPPAYIESLASHFPRAHLAGSAFASAFGTAVAITAWIYIPTTTTAPSAYGGGPERGYLQYSTTGGNLLSLAGYPGTTTATATLALRVNSSDHLASSAQVTRGAWHFISISISPTADGHVQRLHIDGVKVLEVTQAASATGLTENSFDLVCSGSEITSPTYFDSVTLELDAYFLSDYPVPTFAP
jgi:hypothetical protein